MARNTCSKKKLISRKAKVLYIGVGCAAVLLAITFGVFLFLQRSVGLITRRLDFEFFKMTFEPKTNQNGIESCEIEFEFQFKPGKEVLFIPVGVLINKQRFLFEFNILDLEFIENIKKYIQDGKIRGEIKTPLMGVIFHLNSIHLTTDKPIDSQIVLIVLTGDGPAKVPVKASLFSTKSLLITTSKALTINVMKTKKRFSFDFPHFRESERKSSFFFCFFNDFESYFEEIPKSHTIGNLLYKNSLLKLQPYSLLFEPLYLHIHKNLADPKAFSVVECAGYSQSVDFTFYPVHFAPSPELRSFQSFFPVPNPSLINNLKYQKILTLGYMKSIKKLRDIDGKNTQGLTGHVKF